MPNASVFCICSQWTSHLALDITKSKQHTLQRTAGIQLGISPAAMKCFSYHQVHLRSSPGPKPWKINPTRLYQVWSRGTVCVVEIIGERENIALDSSVLCRIYLIVRMGWCDPVGECRLFHVHAIDWACAHILLCACVCACNSAVRQGCQYWMIQQNPSSMLMVF